MLQIFHTHAANHVCVCACVHVGVAINNLWFCNNSIWRIDVLTLILALLLLLLLLAAPATAAGCRLSRLRCFMQQLSKNVARLQKLSS